MAKSFTVTLTFTNVSDTDPLNVAKQVSRWLLEGADTFIYDVTDEGTNEVYTVDLAEEDEEAVLTSNENTQK